MKSILLILSVFLCLSLVSAQEEKNPFIGKQAVIIQDLTPNLVWHNRTDSKDSFKDFEGNVIVLEFSAVWCGPCIASIPHLNQIQDKLGPVGVEVVSVFNSDNNPTLESIMQKHKVGYRVAQDMKNELFNGYNIRSFPQAYVMDVKGKIVWHGHPMELEEGLLVGLAASRLNATPEIEKALQEGDFVKARELANASTDAKAKEAVLGFIGDLAKGEANGFKNFAEASDMEKCGFVDYYEEVFESFGDVAELKDVKKQLEEFKNSDEFEVFWAMYEQEKMAQEEWQTLFQKVASGVQQGKNPNDYMADFNAFLEKYGETEFGQEVRRFLTSRGIQVK